MGKITIPAWKCLRYEVAINGARILRKTINDFSLWRLIEYPETAKWTEAGRGDLVLDVGSGTSTFGQMLAREGARVIVLDLSRERVQWQREKAAEASPEVQARILPVVADATALPFCDGVFERITSVSALEHVPGDAQAASEIGRVLRPNGIAVISVPYTFEERKGFFAGIKDFKRTERNTFVQPSKGNYQVRFYSNADLESRFAQPAHATIERISYFGRKILNDWYSETRLNRYWLSFILKDYVLKLIVHPFEETFLRGTEPFGVIFRMRKTG
ncbi:MAG: class I SAM-dependent methyltransferase [Anaerolineae bacterium]